MLNSNPPLIVLVDDDEAVLNLYSRLISQRARVEAFNSAGELLDQAEVIHPALLVLDWKMPGMDGIELCRELRKRTRLDLVPIVFLSSVEPTLENVREALLAGGQYFLSKHSPVPLVVEQLMAIAGGSQHMLGYLQQQKLMLSVLKHDLQNLLTGVVTGVEVLGMHPAFEDPVLAEQMQIIEQAGGEIRDLLEDLKELLVVRPEDRRKDFERTELEQIACAVREDASRWNLDIEIRDEANPVLYGRPHGVRRALFYGARLMADCCGPTPGLRLSMNTCDGRTVLELSCRGRCGSGLEAALDTVRTSSGDPQQRHTQFLAYYLKTVASTHGATLDIAEVDGRTCLRWIQANNENVAGPGVHIADPTAVVGNEL